MFFSADGSADKVNGFAHVLAASFASLVAAAAHRWRPEPSTVVDKNIIPHLERTESGRVARIEKFSHYVGNVFTFSMDLFYSLEFGFPVVGRLHCG